MPPALGRLRPATQTLRTRLLMAGAFVGAILALSLSWVFSLDGSAGTAAPDEPSPQQVARAAAFHAPPGSCLTWTMNGAANAHLVPCAQPHLFEVTSVEDIAARFPPQAPPPTVDQWRTMTTELCTPDVEAYLGKPLDPEGKLSVNILRPDEQQWAKGDRQVRCGLQRSADSGRLEPTTGRAAEQEQSDVWEPGTCLALAGKSVGPPIDCARPHSFEIVATLNLADEFSDGYPSKDEQNAWLDTQCNEAVKEYSGGADIAAKGLLLGWDLREEASWEAGSTLVNCKVGATLKDSSGLAPVTGSINKPEEPSPPPSSSPGR